jgi:DNA-binding PadR family transcriptional regulator
MTLTFSTLHILLALAKADMIAVDIHSQIAVDSRSTLLLKDNVFYRQLQRMTAKGLIEDAPTSTPKRRVYMLTILGRRLLKQEKSHLLQMGTLLNERVI